MTKAIDDIIESSINIRKSTGDNQYSIIGIITPLLINAFRTKQFTRKIGVEIAAGILSLVEIADDKEAKENSPVQMIDSSTLSQEDKIKQERLTNRIIRDK